MQRKAWQIVRQLSGQIKQVLRDHLELKQLAMLIKVKGMTRKLGGKKRNKNHGLLISSYICHKKKKINTLEGQYAALVTPGLPKLTSKYALDDL